MRGSHDHAEPTSLFVFNDCGHDFTGHAVPGDTPGLQNYEQLTRLTLRLSRDHREVEALVRLAAFNVAAHNRDDHAKQFSFVMDRAGCWTLSPAYDLSFASGPGGEHSTTLACEGRAPGREQLTCVAAAAGVPLAAAGEM